MSLTADLLKEFESQIDALEIIPSDDGRFEIVANGDLIYSKLATGRHAAEGEIQKLIQVKVNR